MTREELEIQIINNVLYYNTRYIRYDRDLMSWIQKSPLGKLVADSCNNNVEETIKNLRIILNENNKN